MVMNIRWLISRRAGPLCLSGLKTRNFLLNEPEHLSVCPWEKNLLILGDAISCLTVRNLYLDSIH